MIPNPTVARLDEVEPPNLVYAVGGKSGQNRASHVYLLHQAGLETRADITHFFINFIKSPFNLGAGPTSLSFN